MKGHQDGLGETAAGRQVNLNISLDLATSGKPTSAPAKEKAPETATEKTPAAAEKASTSLSSQPDQRRPPELYNYSNYGDLPEDVVFAPDLPRPVKMSLSTESGSKSAADDERDADARSTDDTAVFVDALEYHEHPINTIINYLASSAETITSYQLCAKAPRPYNSAEEDALFRPTTVLKYAIARYVPQWDEELLGAAVPEDVNYDDPPEELDYKLLMASVCTGDKACGGIVWLYNKKMLNAVNIHPQHSSYLKLHHLACCTMLVKVASTFVPEQEWRAAQLGISVTFSDQSKFNIARNVKLNEIFYPLVNGKPADGPPPGHRPHELEMSYEVGKLCAAISALRIVERRIVPLRLKMLLDSFHGDRARPDKTLGIQECGQLRVILMTDSKYLVKTMCDHISRYHKRFIPEDDDKALKRLAAIDKKAKKDGKAVLVTGKWKAAAGREPSGDNWEYLRVDGKRIHNNLAITALEAQIELLAKMGVQVKFLLAPKQFVRVAQGFADRMVEISPEKEAKLKRKAEKLKAKALKAEGKSGGTDMEETSSDDNEDYDQIKESAKEGWVSINFSPVKGSGYK